MDIAAGAINRPIYTWLIILICFFGGLWGFDTLGRLEDPAFTIKVAVVATAYPGASAEEVAIEVSEPLESEIQKMGEVDEIETLNQPGVSIINVTMQDIYDGTELPDLWTKLRNRVEAAELPDGAFPPSVNDQFGDVYGLFYAVSAPGYSDADIHRLSSFLRRQMLALDGVKDVTLAGLPEEAIYVEPDLAVTTALGIPPSAIGGALAEADEVVSAGSIVGNSGRQLLQRPTGSDTVTSISALSIGVAGEVLTLSDFATIKRERVSDPSIIIRHNGEEAFTFGVAGIATENIVEIGERVDVRLAELQSQLPLGVSVQPIYQQHLIVDDSVNDFLVNLATSVSIVIVVLALFMGVRAAIVVGMTLMLTVVGSLLFMALGSIEMERISLGALIIAMGMLVDNAIVVAEGMQQAMARGKNSREAARESANKTQIPLLGATVIGIMAFSGIGLSNDSTGEFMFSLFAVICISLLLSWILAITVTPLLGHYLFKVGNEDSADAYSGAIYRGYGGILRLMLKARWAVAVVLIAITAACFALFGQVRQQFFPDSSTPLFFVHYKLPQGASIHKVASDLQIVEQWLQERPGVTDVTSFAGGGAARFMLTYESEDDNASYGHLIVRVASLDTISDEMTALEEFAADTLTAGQFRTERLAFGPGGGASIEARFFGPDPKVLRALAVEARARMEAATENALNIRIDWAEPEPVLRPMYAEARAQESGISRTDITQTLEFATTGSRAGTYREEDRQIPLILRAPPDNQLLLTDFVLYSEATGEFVPMEQVVDGLSFEIQDTLIERQDRENVITVGADIPRGFTATEVQVEVNETIEAMELPPGYRFEWGGELKNSADAQESLGTQLPTAILIMLLITILLFNGLRQTAIIWLLVPMSVNGAALGLVGTGLPFTFTALLGLLSLSGMLIKNGIVLVEEIDLAREADPQKPLADAITEASVSRLRPVLLAAATTILGMIPLLPDAFFSSMAVTIMGGLAFASILTLIAAPVFYMIFFNGSVRRAQQRMAEAGDAELQPAG
ncbi:MAG: efflux RND transporter permease subunit [Pseudomonadota bacterium]